MDFSIWERALGRTSSNGSTATITATPNGHKAAPSSSVRSSIEDPTFPLTSANILSFLGGTPTYTGRSVTEANAPTNVAVFRACSLIAGTVASLPLKGYRGEGPDRAEIRSALLRAPHRDMPAFELLELITWHLCLFGSAFLAVERDGGGLPIFVDPIPPPRVTVKKVPPTTANPNGRLFEVALDSGDVRTFTSYDVLAINGPSLDGVRGMSPVQMAKNAIATGLDLEAAAAKFFASGLMVSGIFQADGEVTQAQADAVKARWKEMASGVAHAHEVAVMSGGKFTPVSVDPEKAQMTAQREFQRSEVATLYGLQKDLTPPVAADFLRWVLMPYLRRIEGRFSLLLPRGTFAEFRTAGILRSDLSTRYGAFAVALQNGFASVNEVRALDNMPSIGPDGDVYARLAPGVGTPNAHPTGVPTT